MMPMINDIVEKDSEGEDFITDDIDDDDS